MLGFSAHNMKNPLHRDRGGMALYWCRNSFSGLSCTGALVEWFCFELSAYTQLCMGALKDNTYPVTGTETLAIQAAQGGFWEIVTLPGVGELQECSCSTYQHHDPPMVELSPGLPGTYFHPTV